MILLDCVELTGVAAMSGTAQEIREKLRSAGNEQFVAFLLPHVSAQERDAIAQTVATLVHLTRGRLISRERARLESLVDAFLPTLGAPEVILRETEMIAKARAAVLDSAEWLPAAAITDLAKLSPINPNAGPSRWKAKKRIFTIKPAGSVELFPAYGLDPHNSHRPLPAMADVITVLGSSKDGWGLAYWFGSVNGYLGGRRPQDVLAIDPSTVVAAARDEVEGFVHG